MSTKSDQLIKRLAALFVDYSISDWQPLIAELRKSSAHEQLAVEIEKQLLAAESHRVKTRRAIKAAPKKVRKLAPKPIAEVILDADLSLLRSALISRKIFSSIGALREAAEVAGLKGTQNGDRKELIEKLTMHLAGMSTDPREAAISKLMKTSKADSSDRGSEFERWASIIMQTRSSR